MFLEQCDINNISLWGKGWSGLLDFPFKVKEVPKIVVVQLDTNPLYPSGLFHISPLGLGGQGNFISEAHAVC